MNGFDLKYIFDNYRKGIMGIAILLILLFHERFFEPAPLFGLFRSFGYWGVDIFMFISGYGIYYSLTKNNLKTYYKNRFNRLILPLILMFFVKLIIDVFFAKGANWEHRDLVWESGVNLWFLQAIIIYYIISPFFVKNINNRLLLAIFVICLLLTFVIDVYQIRIISFRASWIIARFPAYAFGAYCAKNVSKINQIYKSKLSVIFFIFCIAVSVCLHLLCNQYEYLNLPQFIVLVPALPLIIYVFSLILRINVLQCVFGFLGTITLEIYIIHEFLYYWLVEKYNGLIGFLISVILSILISYVVHFVCEHLKKIIFVKK